MICILKDEHDIELFEIKDNVILLYVIDKQHNLNLSKIITAIKSLSKLYDIYIHVQVKSFTNYNLVKLMTIRNIFTEDNIIIFKY